LNFTRQRFQRGTLRKVARADNQWAWEYRYQDPLTRKRKSLYLSVEEFATQTAAERHLEHLVLKLNDEHPALAVYDPPFDVILDRFIADERLLEIKSIRPGEKTEGVGELSYSTATGYLSNIKRIRERWGTFPISRMKPMKIQEWLKGLDLAPKTKGHIKAVMHRLFEKAMLWELVEWQRNPMQLVEIKGISKRRKRPVILTVDQFFLGFELVPQPYRTMVMLAICSGVRAEEVLAIEKPDIHFEKLSLQLFRAVVHGRVKFVKTEYSEDELPLDPDLAAILLNWIRQCDREAREKMEATGIEVAASDLLFTSPVTGRHYHASPIQQDYFRPAWCCLVACPECRAGTGVWCSNDSPVPNGRRLPLHEERWEAAGKYGHVGWHTFRHTYRSWLDDTGAPIGVQQKLMRHAQVATTMNVYGNALMESKREANRAVVNKILRSSER
jgi:integrase